MLGRSVFRLAKDGSTRAEYEDAIAWSRRHRRFAVADGASASAFARRWAELLVRAYVTGRLASESLEADLVPLQQQWSAEVEARELPWYAVEQARRGAFAALVGLTLDERGTWSALAVGDACLFQVRAGQLQTALPLDDPAAFGNNPLLLGSRAAANTCLRADGAIVASAGTWEAGDTFLLMSDALAASFLHRHRQLQFEPPLHFQPQPQPQPELQPAQAQSGSALQPQLPLAQIQPCSALQVLDFPRTARGFRRWVRWLRAERLLRNDDVSLIWLDLPTDAPA
ncbi:MAG: protein phosphatase 2C domain-containing protein [Chloroflexi bacterium]|nr:protein phosphatase 2C domain-containing protein [Chloroflexota bacterium]